VWWRVGATRDVCPSPVRPSPALPQHEELRSAQSAAEAATSEFGRVRARRHDLFMAAFRIIQDAVRGAA
jgi:hypothetical protein